MINKSYSSLNDLEAFKGSSILNAKNLTIWGLLTSAFSYIVGIATIPMRLLLRSNIGERSIRVGSFLIALGLHIYAYFKLGIYVVGFQYLMGGIEFEGILVYVLILLNPYVIFLLFILAVGVKHFRQKISQALSFKVGNSYHRGESKYFENWRDFKIFGFVADDTVIRMLVEPRAVMKYSASISLFCLSIVFLSLAYKFNLSFFGILISSMLTSSILFFLTGLCLFVEEFSLYMVKRDRALDLLDGEFDMKEILSMKNHIEQDRNTRQQKVEDGLEDEAIID